MGMFFVGHLGEHLNLCMFLTFGITGSRACVGFFGLSHSLNINLFILLDNCLDDGYVISGKLLSFDGCDGGHPSSFI
jgi:hypothetical protein